MEFQAVPVVTVKAASGAGLRRKDLLAPMAPTTLRISWSRIEVFSADTVTDLAPMIVLAMLAFLPVLDNLRAGG